MIEQSLTVSGTSTDQESIQHDYPRRHGLVRVGRSPAQSLPVNTVRVELALFRTGSLSPRSCVPRRYRRRHFDAMMSDFEGFARDLTRRLVAKAMSGRRGAKN